MNTRTVTLEILRPGPAHNQLLSPLTAYVAVCSNRSPETLHLDVEHHQFLRWVRDLSSQSIADGGAEEARRAVTRILGSLRGLAAELAGAKVGEPVHLRLVLSAQELASLPFELADAPPGFPAEGQALFRQATTPISITRESRRVPKAALTWPDRPKILFAWASPPGVNPVPHDAHALVLRQAVDPWFGWCADEAPEDQLRELAGHLTILPAASWESIKEACGRGRYSHVHLLAHGVPTTSDVPGNERFGLLLHDAASGRRVVDADDLDVALRGGNAANGAPTVVTIAACNIGTTPGVMLPGSSLAHVLHEKGIPLVIASQFPLTYRGSVVMTRVIYQGLLEGDDPRHVLQHARRELYSSCPATHDWASVVSYASLPANLDVQLPMVRFARARKRADVAVHRARTAWEAGAATIPQALDELDAAVASVEVAGRQMLDDAALPDLAPQEAQIRRQVQIERESRLEAYRASVALRWADALLVRTPTTRFAREHAWHDCRLQLSHMTIEELLRLALERYRAVFRLTQVHWSLVQALSLEWALGGEEGEARLDRTEWSMAWRLASSVTGAEALGSQAQLALLAVGWNEPFAELSVRDPATELLRKIVTRFGTRSLPSFLARRQIERFVRWASLSPHSEAKLLVGEKATMLLGQSWMKDVPTWWPER